MRRSERFELNQRLARLEAHLDAIDPSPDGPPRAAPFDMFSPWRQAELLREGRVYQGQVY